MLRQRSPGSDRDAAVISLVGMSHRTAPFGLLERASTAVAELVEDGLGATTTEWLPVLTCNRVELYLVHGAGTPAVGAAIDELAARMGIGPEELSGCVYLLEGADAIRHVMRLAAGLDSMIIGEVEILGQLTRALADAGRRGTAGLVLTRLLRAAGRAGRRARAETAISRHTISISQAAARVALGAVGNPASTQALVVGAGEAAGLAAQALRHSGAGRILCTNRTDAHAEALARRVDGEALPWRRLRDGLALADVVLAATSAPEPVVRVGDVEGLARDGRPLALVDLAVPRDIEAAVGSLPAVRLYSIADLRSVVDDGLARRREEIPAVEAIVADEAERFRLWLAGRRVAPLITELRGRVVRVAHAEVRAAFDASRPDEDLDAVAERVAERIATRVLHEPVVRLKASAADGAAATHITAMRELFALGRPEEAEGA